MPETEQAISSPLRPPRPESRLRLTEAGLEMFIRYPVPLEDASGVDERVTRALLDAIEREPSLKLVGASSPTLQPAQ